MRRWQPFAVELTPRGAARLHVRLWRRGIAGWQRTLGASRAECAALAESVALLVDAWLREPGWADAAPASAPKPPATRRYIARDLPIRPQRERGASASTTAARPAPTTTP